MFCLKCNEAIPDGSTTCPYCGFRLKEANTQPTVIYATAMDDLKPSMNESDRTTKKIFYGWCAFAAISFVFLSLNYFTVNVSLYRSGTSDSAYSGYGLMKCLKGSIWLSGYMVIFIILTNIAVLFTGLIGANTKISNKNVWKGIVVIESAAYLITSIVPYLIIKNALSAFNPDITETGIGIGCYLNILLSIAAAVYCLAGICRHLNN